MSKQPEALRLADGNDECAKAWLDSSDAHKFRKDTAAELRRLHEANAELLEALKGLDEAYCRAGSPLTRDERTEDRKRLISAREAIAKATGEQQ